jgi:pimeloyl-ACP methyl ester carboxylesterase
MSGQHRWTIGLATSTGILGLTVTSGLALLANRFIDEFSRPHELVDESEFTWRMPETYPYPPLSSQRALLFKTSDGTLLSGDFWAQTQPAPTIVLCHGYRISRSHLRSVAALEYSFGYNVLLFDFRGHGASDSVATSGGNAEVRDLEAAIVVAGRQKETLPDKIIVHGFSMGASVALLTPPRADVIAIIADSPYARSDDILRRIVCYRLTQESNGWTPLLRQLRHLIPAVAWATVTFSTIVFRIRFGYDFVARPDTSFRRWKTRAKTALPQHSIPILLIHAVDDNMIPIAHARQIVAEAKAYGIPLETHFSDGGSHCGAYSYNPQEYKKVIRNFLARHLGNDFPAQHRGID